MRRKMEGDTRLMRVIRDMRSQINKLEQENQALRGARNASAPESEAQSLGAGSERRSPRFRKQTPRSPIAGSRAPNVQGVKAATGSPTSQRPEDAPSVPQMRRTVSADAALGLQDANSGSIMTVRRYSISSTVQSVTSNKRKHIKRHSRSSSFEPNQPGSSTVKDFTKHGESISKIPSHGSANSITSSRSLQKYMQRCRSKATAVNFLLPMDTSSFTDTQSCLKYSNQQETKQLSTIMEKDP